MWLKKLRAKLSSPRKKVARAAAATIAYDSTGLDTRFIPLAAITDVVLPQPVTRQRDGHIGMQGYAPIIRISINRRYCEFCGERVLPSPRHVCWGNAEHHMQTLTADERTRILAQLAKKPRRLTRMQLKKLYRDGQGMAEIEGERYGD